VDQQEQRPLILLVDDDRLTAAAWTTVLRMNGFEVVWAPDGGSAWALARIGRPDLLLTDWDMPGIDGPELCRIFRKDPVLASVPIILASSLSLPPAGPPDLHNLFLQKPVDAVALLTAVSALAAVAVAADTSQADDARPDERLRAMPIVVASRRPLLRPALGVPNDCDEMAGRTRQHEQMPDRMGELQPAIHQEKSDPAGVTGSACQQPDQTHCGQQCE
jgi:CheY-like chemotaxis protein